MRALAFLLLLACLAEPIVIVPPVVYFLTLSLSTFIANALVSVLLLGAFKGLFSHRYAGRTPYQLLRLGLSLARTALLGMLCMIASVLLLYPVEIKGILLSGALSGLLFFVLKALFASREYGVSGTGRRRSLLASWLLLSSFVAVATGVSANMSVNVERVRIGTGIGDAAPLEDSYAPSVSREVAKGYEYEPKADIAYSQAEARMWFMPREAGECIVRVGELSAAYPASKSCISEGESVLGFCPVAVDHKDIRERGLLSFSATGSCDDYGFVFVSDKGFEYVER